VDAEIPSPAAGVLVEVKIGEGETVEVGTVVAFIDTEAAPGTADASADPPAPAPSEAPAPPAAPPPSAPAAPAPTAATGDATAEERLRTKSTPVVRKIAEEAGVDISHVSGTGHMGRVTKQDILDYIESGGASSAPPPAPAPAPASTPAPSRPAAPVSGDLWDRFYGEVHHPEFPVRDADRVETMDKIRRLTAEHMVLAKRISPHVHSFIEIDFSAVDRIRRENKARWAEQGARVSYTAFVAWACSRILRDFPQINGTISGNNIIYRGAVNLGMAVDLNPGLIVPVIHDTDDLSLVGIGKKIIDLAERARTRKLSPMEVQGATFSITNPGVLGTMVGMPVIPKGTSAILGTGAIEKRVVVVTDPETGADAMAIRKRSYFSLGYDHRLVDGADAARFLARLKELLEDFPDDA
ncbi:MAG: 2-oxo acid dehydrogenase subunit E2, partial [Gemmatimonadetes bacterium]|nr:2-oxo acid dehydrogenase subunit E2 [Gemmatimonadota bacterium]